MERKYGYIRISSKDQNEARQVLAMEELGIDKNLIFIDKQSGKDFKRPEYQLLKRILRKGDVLYVKSLDRFGRNKQQILEEWEELTGRGIDIVIMDMPILDTTRFKELRGLETLIQDIVLHVLSWIAEDERKRIKERQEEGIEAAKKMGKHLGRPSVQYPENFKEEYNRWKAGEITAKKCMEILGLKPNTFYRRVRAYESKEGRLITGEKN